MATNTLNIIAANSGEIHGLHGDMDVYIDLNPGQSFGAGFFVKQAGNYVITASQGVFRQADGTTASSLTLTGVNRFVWLMFSDGVWEMPFNNMIAAVGGGGGEPVKGDPGIAATLELGTYEMVPYGQPFQITFTGTPSARIINIKWPAGKDGVDSAGTGTGGGTGTGTFSPEVELPVVNGVATPNRNLGNNYRLLQTGPLKFGNPIGYAPGEHIVIALRQGDTAPYTSEWDTNWAHPNRAVPRLSQQPGGLTKITAHLTAPIGTNSGGWMTDVTPPNSDVGYGVPAFIAKNITTNVSYYVLRSGTVPANQCGMTDMKPGQTLKILRNGLGVEAYGAIDGNINGAGNYLISGAMPNGSRAELRTGPGVRSAYDRGVLGFTGPINVIIQDIILAGAEENGVPADQGGACGITITGAANVTTKNVLIRGNQNGVLTGSSADYQGTMHFIDTEFAGNGLGRLGFTHNIYAGEHLQPWYATRTTFRDAVGAHNIKTRSGDCILKQVLCHNAVGGREIDCPNGGQIHAEDGSCVHLESGDQNDCVSIGQEGILEGRPRGYTFRNYHFANFTGPGNGGSYVRNEDTVPVYLIDCTFEGVKGNGVSDSNIWPGSDANGNIGNVILQFTPGVTPGPRLPVGYQPIPVTQIA